MPGCSSYAGQSASQPAAPLDGTLVRAAVDSFRNGSAGGLDGLTPQHLKDLVCSSAGEAGLALWCYQCTAATPGCMEPFNWRGVGYLGNPCPDNEDICVKLIERKGAQEVITRDCLSNFRAFRTDIPADTYEGCRPAARDVNLANYVNNSIKELDIKRDWYDETIWCFCFLDHRCNGASSMATMALLIPSCIVFLFTKMMF